MVPGLGMIAVLTLFATLLASVPGIKIMGALGLALIVGMLLRSSFALLERSEAAKGTFGVIGFILTQHVFGFSSQHYGILTGATLQEVGQVIAANPVGSSELDFATLTKLARVALLAPALLVASSILRTRSSSHPKSSLEHPPLLPSFLIGFLGVGVINSTGLLPKDISSVLQQLSIYLTTAAMIGICLGVDFRAVRRVGARALGLGLIGFAVLIGLNVVYLGIFLKT